MKEYLGKRAKDKITGFEGYITSYCIHLTGCDRLMIESVIDSENRKSDSVWLDLDRIEIIAE